MNKQLNIDNTDDFTLMYFNKNFIKKECHSFIFYRYKTYIYMDKNYSNILVDNQSITNILLQYIDSNYTSYSVTYNSIAKVYTIEWYTD